MTTQQISAILNAMPKLAVTETASEQDVQLYDILAKLNGFPPGNLPTTNFILDALDKIQSISTTGLVTSQPEPETSRASPELKNAVLMRLMLSAYPHVSDTLLNESIEAEDEAYWWANIERDTWGSWYYLLQTLPSRIIRLSRQVLTLANEQDIQSFSDSFGRLVVPPIQVFNAIFPALKHYPTLSRSPLLLIQKECSTHRERLERIRDERAEQLGRLTLLGATISTAVSSGTLSPFDESILLNMQTVLVGGSPGSRTSHLSDIPDSLRQFLTKLLPQHVETHKACIQPYQRPSRWTRIWPKVVFGPPIVLFVFRSIYSNRGSIRASVVDAMETIKGFWMQWVVGPAKDILNTVRTGGESGPRVTSKEGLKSDMDSLERMVISLATEKQSWSEQELKILSEKIRQGDLTPVLQIYEGDIRKPLRSAISGTLIRSLLIQVQKAKVDIDFALEGIDKLLRSQELTFGFVGVAPSLAVLYIVCGWIRSLWRRGLRTKYGDKHGREESFYLIRRIERLLLNAGIPSPSSKSPLYIQPSSHSTALPAQTQGLLIVSITHLRRYAERSLPNRSRIREGFLEDLLDLENPSFSRDEKLSVVQRMWRSWSQELGWGDTLQK